ncbi:MAG: hypothetical protein ACOX37_08720 [Bacillota bacterium]
MESAGFFRVSREAGRIQLQAMVLPSAEGLTVAIYGGDKPHVGAVALAVPRPSLMDPAKTSATVSVLTLIGHKDDEIAKPAAEKLAKELEQPVALVAGVHLDNPSQTEIDTVISLAGEIVDEIVLRFPSKGG